MIRPGFAVFIVPALLAGQPNPADTGAPQVQVTQTGTAWQIAGRKNVVSFDEKTFAISVKAGPVVWKMLPSSAEDMVARLDGDEFPLALKDAADISITRYETGFKTGIRIALDGFRSGGVRSRGAAAGIGLVLTLCLEGADDDLVAEVTAIERGGVVRELRWPGAMNGRDVDYTVISSDDGTLLPRDWPRPYHPIQRRQGDLSLIQSHLIESWAMSWWGFQQRDSAMIVIVETPDDAAYIFSHPAGGPTTMGPAWRAQLGRFNYLRSVRMAFLPKGNYVDLAKQYRRHVQDSGNFISLREKIASRPIVANIIGNPFTGLSVLRNLSPGSANYSRTDPARNYRLTTFEQNIQRLRDLHAKGFRRINVSLSGWLTEGYDRRTPDALPPAPAAGGWAGMKAFFDACKQLEFTCWLHDQYRDYYKDAPSWNPDFAVHEEDTRPARAFPGTRFKHDWKEGFIPLMDNWDGGAQGYLNNRFMLGHVVKNYRTMFEHGVRPQGSYQDVFGYIPPDEDFNPNHPSTRRDSMYARIAVMRWVKNNLGIVGTEDGADWTVPYVDYLTSRANRSSSTGTDPDHQDAIQVPLYELVYHDAVVTTYSANDLRGFLHASAPQMGYGRSGVEPNWENVRRMAALHKRVGMLEMTRHEFLDRERTRERTTFADGTTVTVDWKAKTAAIAPEVQ